MDKNKCTSCGEAPKKCSCKNKEFTKAVIEIDNPEQITLMRKVVIPASMGDDTTVPPVVGKYKNVLLFYEANSKSYLYSSDGIPTQLVNGLTDYEQAVNLPEINGVTLMGNKSSADLKLADAPMVITVATGNTSWSGADTAEDVYNFFLNKGKVNIVFNGGENYAYEITSAAYIPEEEKMMCIVTVATATTGETTEFDGNALFGTMTLYTADKAIDVGQIELQPKLFVTDFTGLNLNNNELSGVPATTYSIGMVKPGDGLEVDTDGTLSISEIEQYAHFFDTVADMKAVTNMVDGDYARTYGYHTKNDGGGALYKISNATPSSYYETLNSGKYAELITNGVGRPEQFGAKGDGVNDDTQAILEAFTMGKVELMPKKVYLTDEISLSQSQYPVVINGNLSTLKLKEAGSNTSILNLNGRSALVENLVFDGNSTNVTMLKTSNETSVNEITIKGCEFKNASAGYGNAVDIEYYKKCEVVNCYFHDIEFSGYHIIRVNHITVDSNVFEDIGEAGNVTPLGEGMYNGNCQSISIVNNSYKNITGSTIYISYGFANLVNVCDNRLENCKKDGIKVQTQAKRAIISNNILKDICAQAIMLTATSLDCMIENNIIEGACLPGGISSGTKNSAIEALSSHNTIISGNIVRFVHAQNVPAIRVLKADADSNLPTNVNIVNNIIDGISGRAINCVSIQNLLIEGNNIKNTNLNDTTTKMTMMVQDCIGAINGNSFNEPEYIYGICYKTGDNTIQLPKGLTPACIQSNNDITIYANNIESPIFSTQDTTITSINTNTNEATLNDNITVVNNVNPTELYFKLDVTHIKLNNSFYIRNTGKFSLIGNYVHSTGGYNVYMNQASNVTCVPDVGTNVNNFWNMNIK